MVLSVLSLIFALALLIGSTFTQDEDARRNMITFCIPLLLFPMVMSKDKNPREKKEHKAKIVTKEVVARPSVDSIITIKGADTTKTYIIKYEK